MNKNDTCLYQGNTVLGLRVVIPVGTSFTFKLPIINFENSYFRVLVPLTVPSSTYNVKKNDDFISSSCLSTFTLDQGFKSLYIRYFTQP